MLVKHSCFLMSSRSTSCNGALLLFLTFVSLTSFVLIFFSIAMLSLFYSLKLCLELHRLGKLLLLLSPWNISYWIFNIYDSPNVTSLLNIIFLDSKHQSLNPFAPILKLKNMVFLAPRSSLHSSIICRASKNMWSIIIGCKITRPYFKWSLSLVCTYWQSINEMVRIQ